MHAVFESYLPFAFYLLFCIKYKICMDIFVRYLIVLYIFVVFEVVFEYMRKPHHGQLLQTGWKKIGGRGVSEILAF